MSKRRITKASKRRLTVFGTISLIAIIYFNISLILNCYSIYDLTREKAILENKFALLQQEADNLKLDIQKLNDPKYLADYARENYLYSKDDEYIIQIEEIIETQDEIEFMQVNINKNYILTGLCFLICALFIYIFIKSRKNTQKK